MAYDYNPRTQVVCRACARSAELGALELEKYRRAVSASAGNFVCSKCGAKNAYFKHAPLSQYIAETPDYDVGTTYDIRYDPESAWMGLEDPVVTGIGPQQGWEGYDD